MHSHVFTILFLVLVSIVNHSVSLVLIAHGSRSPQASAEIQHFTAGLNTRFSATYYSCKPAFLEMASPSITDCVTQMHQDGIKEVHLLPYFLSSGVHVTQDIPEIAAELAQKFPHLRIKILPAIGLMPQMSDVVAAMVDDVMTESDSNWSLNQTA